MPLRSSEIAIRIIHLFKCLCKSLFKWKGNNSKNIDIKEKSEGIGEEKAWASIGFHAIAGSYFTSKFNGKSKDTFRKIFNESDELVQSSVSKWNGCLTISWYRKTSAKSFEEMLLPCTKKYLYSYEFKITAQFKLSND